VAMTDGLHQRVPKNPFDGHPIRRVGGYL